MTTKLSGLFFESLSSLPVRKHLICDQTVAAALPFLLHDISKEYKRVLMIAEDDVQLRALETSLYSFGLPIPVFVLPAWDCIPYDRVSPRRDILAERAKALSQLAGWEGGYILLTTISGMLQKIPPLEVFSKTHLHLSLSKPFSEKVFREYLTENGYLRVETVRESGEYAIRGGLIDLYPSGAEKPVRIDLFGEDIESLHFFDPLTQLREEKVDQIDLFPTSELILDDERRERFKDRYRQLFGHASSKDFIYQSILQGVYQTGIEHWLPLFYETLTNVFEITRADIIIQPQDLHLILKEKFEEIQDHYTTRLRFQSAESDFIYNPLEPSYLYLDQSQITHSLDTTTTLTTTSFAVEGADLSLQTSLLHSLKETNPSGEHLYDKLKEYVKETLRLKKRVIFTLSSLGNYERLERLLQAQDLPSLVRYDTLKECFTVPKSMMACVVADLENGFEAPNFTLIHESMLFGEKRSRSPKRRRRSDLFIAEASSINPGDYVVHEDHGIGQYIGLETLNIDGAPHDCLCVMYEGNDKLFVPVENIEILSRFGGEDSTVRLDKLGQAAWQMRKAKVKKNLMEMAGKLIDIAATRKSHPGEIVQVLPGLYDEFTTRFPFAETEDQDRAIREVFEDLESGNAMDRLICGDVGFGKTEVALRASFVVATGGHQVALVVPTTLLCRQHYQNFSRRFEGTGIRVEQLSRLVKPKQAAHIRRDMKDGKVDIIISTHALFSKDIQFKNLGLLIVDEEQHFGVKQKERLKELKNNVHVLSMTATPIPRTLQMALAGVRDMSIIATPPVDRLAVRTFVQPYDGVVIREALMREHHRGGHSFYVCPRIKDLKEVYERLQKIVPELTVVSVHGQMPAKELEDVMESFLSGKYDILLATNIIESGIDIPTANTLIVHRADMFGLSQLYQLRGRVGRSKIRSYAYLTVPNDQLLSKTAQKRLEVMQTLDSLGAGFQLASHDLDIRGAGNLLGEQQSGHIKEVGVELYQNMLEEAILQVQHSREKSQDGVRKPFEESWIPQINVGVAVLIPEEYVRDLSVRLELYRRVARLETPQEVEEFSAELVDRFGSIPQQVRNLLDVITLKQLCKQAHVAKVDAGTKGIVFTFHKKTYPDPERLVLWIQQMSGLAKLRPDQSLVYLRSWQDIKDLFEGISKILEYLRCS